MEFEKLNSMMKLKDLTNLIQDKVHQGGMDQKAKNTDLSGKPVSPTKDKVQMYDFRGDDLKLSIKTESARVRYSPRRDIYDVMGHVRMAPGMMEAADRAIFSSVGDAVANDAQYKVIRNGKEYEVEVYFPNENGNITLRVECDGKEEIREFSPDEDRNLANHTNEIADRLFRDVGEVSNMNLGTFKDALPSVIGSGFNNNDESAMSRRAKYTAIPDEGIVSGKLESVLDANIKSFSNPIFNRRFALFEADAPKPDEESAPESQPEVSPGDVNATAASDTGAPSDAAPAGDMPAGDMGGDLGGSDLGSLGGGGSLGGLPDDAYSVHGQEGSEGAAANANPNGNYDPDTLFGQLMTRYAPTPEGMSIPFVNGMVYLISQVNYDNNVQSKLTPTQMVRGFSGLNGEPKPAVIINQFFDMFPSFKNLPVDGRFEGNDTGSAGVNFVQACEQAPDNGYKWFTDTISGLYSDELGLSESDKAAASAFGSKDGAMFAKEPEIPATQSPEENAFPGLSPEAPKSEGNSGYGDLFGAAKDFNKVAQEAPPEETKKI